MDPEVRRGREGSYHPEKHLELQGIIKLSI
jgi:hypothetical protein